MKYHWLLVVTLLSTASLASPVIEYVNDEGAHIFDATGDNNEIVLPSAPREFASVADYMKFMLSRFHGQAIFNEKGEFIDVTGVWKVYGTAMYVHEGVKRTVTEPIALTIAGRFGYVIIAGTKYEMFIDDGIPPLDEIENVWGYSTYGFRKSCSGAPLSVSYCMTAEGFKHIYLHYQSIGSNTNLHGIVRVTPATRIDYDVRFQNSSGTNLPIVYLDTTSPGRHRETIFNRSGLGYAQWGIFGNPFIDPTKILLSAHASVSPTTMGTSGSSLVHFPWRLP